MATIASLGVALTAETGQLRRDLGRATAINREFAQRTRRQYQAVSQSINGLRAAFLGFIAAAGAAQLFRTVDEVSRLAESASIGIVPFQRLAFAFEQSGLSARQAAQAIQRVNNIMLQAAQGSTEAVRALDALGLTFSDLEGLSPEERFFTLVDALRAIEDPGLRAALTTRLFGEELGLLFGSILTEGSSGLIALGDQLTNTFTEEDVMRIREFNDTMGLLVTTFQNFIIGLSPVLNAITPIINAFSQLLGTSRLLQSAIILAFGAAALRPVISGFTLLRDATFGIREQFLRAGATARTFSASMRDTSGPIVGVTRRLGILNGRLTLTAARMARGGIVARTFGRGLRLAAVGVRSIGFAVRFALGPVGLILLAIEGLIFVFTRWGNEISSFIAQHFTRFIQSIQRAYNWIAELIGLDPVTVWEDWEPAVAGAADATDDLNDSLGDANATFDDLNSNVDDFDSRLQGLLDTLFPARAEFNRYLDNLQLLNEAFDMGKITVDQYNEALAALNATITAPEEGDAWLNFLDEAADRTTQLQSLGMRAFNGLADALTDFVTTGRADFASLARSIIADLIRIQIRAALSGIFGAASGGGGFLGSLFGGFRQEGGPVAAGQAYVVGEAGPELFVPNANGAIISNENANRGGGDTININISAVDAPSFQALLARESEFVTAVVDRGNRTIGRRR